MNPSFLWSVSGLLFLLGAFCMAVRRHLLAMVLGLELMVNAANLLLVQAAVRRGDPGGLAVALLVIAAAAAEVVVGFSLILALGREGAVETQELRDLAG